MRLIQFPKAKACFYDIKPVLRAEDKPSATDIWIYDVIGDDWYDPSLTAKELCQKIAAIDTDEIVLHFNSPGGSVSDGIAIYNALMTHPATVTSLIEGWTSSIATVVALAGEHVAMFDNTMFIIHNPWGIQIGPAKAMHEYGDYLERVGELMSKIYLAHTDKSDAELQDALDAETSFTAEQAAEWGFVDEVIAGQAAAAAVDTAVLEALGLHAPGGVGRTLSAESEEKLRDASTLIDDILATLNGKAGSPAPGASGDGRRNMRAQQEMASLLTAAKRH